MSIATRTGDQGETALMFNKRVPKDHPRVETYGTLDELNAALGMAKASTTESITRNELEQIQKDLVAIMGQLAVREEDADRYQKAGYPSYAPEMLQKLDDGVARIESASLRFDGWATPGANPHAASLDMARTICRRAERRVCSLDRESGADLTPILQYLNRLSDYLWLLARQAECPHASR